MSNSISDVVKQLLDGMHTISKTETVIGEPLVAEDNSTVIPIHRIRVAFAAGVGKGDGKAASREGQGGTSGAGGMVQIDPVAVIAVGSDGAPRILSVDGDVDGGVTRLLDRLPDLLLKAAQTVSDRVAPELAAVAAKRLKAAGDPSP